ncbi:hypothetical protein CTI12_AA393280 [Artemisia annua]|uniref:Uncharacterized protein n=1 Tax=Artemisia annua TaxID=35608 RepID=A0A2U1M7S5_ARTAN|nr:hypothetical protein CTI12_AA393280 [Artemisia annua]
MKRLEMISVIRVLKVMSAEVMKWSWMMVVVKMVRGRKRRENVMKWRGLEFRMLLFWFMILVKDDIVANQSLFVGLGNMMVSVRRTLL